MADEKTLGVGQDRTTMNRNELREGRFANGDENKEMLWNGRFIS